MYDLTLDLPVVHDNGMFISSKISRIVELIREYDPRLDVKWIPPDRRDFGDPAFAITERLSDGREVVGFYIQDEEQFDESVLARVYAADTTKHDVQARIEAQNRAAKAVQAARHRESLDQSLDFVRTLFGSKKHTFKHNGRKLHL